VADTNLLVLGTRLLAQEVGSIISSIPGFRLRGFVENQNKERSAEKILGHPVYWIDELKTLAKDHKAVSGLTTTQRKLFIEQARKYSIDFSTVIDPHARISSDCLIGKGTVAHPGVIVASHVKIGRHVLLNRGSLLGHHTTIGDYTTINPGANIAGACTLGNQVYVGIGAVILDHLTIGDGAIVGAGSVVTENVPAHAQVVGIPARVVKQDIEPK